MLHAAAMFDVNECGLDWFFQYYNMRKYVDVIGKVFFAELPHILMEEYELYGHYKANFFFVLRKMLADLRRMGVANQNTP